MGKNAIAAIVATTTYFIPCFVSASIIAVTGVTGALLTGGGTPVTTRGFAFVSSQDIFVDNLGLWDEFGDGLVESHQVGIWDLGENLLVSTEIQSGTLSPIIDGVVEGGRFRYEPIAPLLLLACT